MTCLWQVIHRSAENRGEDDRSRRAELNQVAVILSPRWDKCGAARKGCGGIRCTNHVSVSAAVYRNAEAGLFAAAIGTAAAEICCKRNGRIDYQLAAAIVRAESKHNLMIIFHHEARKHCLAGTVLLLIGDGVLQAQLTRFRGQDQIARSISADVLCAVKT